MDKDQAWQQYSNLTRNNPARPRLIETLKNFCTTPGHALDFGCGGGRDTRELLTCGWTVDALDGDAAALKLTVELQTEEGRLNVIHSRFEDITLEDDKYDLINASVSLPFCNPKDLGVVWNKLLRSLKCGGVISCDFFGTGDDWNIPAYNDMSFLEKSEVEELLSGLKTLISSEQKSVAPTAVGPEKNWHIFTCIARKL